jgi:hypothetical protein
MAQAKLISSLEDFEEIFYFPPFHPGCRCVPIAVSSEEASETIPEAVENIEPEIIPEDDDPLIAALRKIPGLPELTDKEAFDIWKGNEFGAISGYLRELPVISPKWKTDMNDNPMQASIDNYLSGEKDYFFHKNPAAALLRMNEKFKNTSEQDIGTLYRSDNYAADKIFADARILSTLKKLDIYDNAYYARLKNLDKIAPPKGQSWEDYFKSKLVGKTYSDKSYMATSTDEGTAMGYINMWGSEQGEDNFKKWERKPVVFRITGAASSVDMKEITGNSIYTETLLNRNLNMKVSDVHVQSDKFGSYLVIDWNILSGD